VIDQARWADGAYRMPGKTLAPEVRDPPAEDGDE
jgi:hypothetical protein